MSPEHPKMGVKASEEMVGSEVKGLIATGHLRKALNLLNIAIKENNARPYLYRMRAFVYGKLRRYDLAEHDLTEAIELTPSCAEAFYQRGQVRMLMGLIDLAIEDYTACLNLKPDNAGGYSARAGLYMRQGNYVEALKDINAALSVEPDNPDYLHNRAVVLTALKRYGDAIRDYTRVLRLRPESAGTYNNLAWIYTTADDSEFRDCHRAIEYARKAIEKGKNPGWMDTLALAYAECGQLDEAARIEAEAYRLSSPPNPLFYKRAEEYKRGIANEKQHA